jgi:cyclohexa-1,5-dienecarbonyl-CoA hydratase
MGDNTSKEGATDMPELKHHRVERADGVARITLNRPKHNVFNIEMLQEFNTLMDTLGEDKELQCIAVFGEGPSWCAGVEVGDHKPEQAPDMIATFAGMFERIHALEVPLIAAVHGNCLGGGMELAIACDIVIASAKAKFGQPEIKLGFFPPYAAVRLPELVGPAKAVEICTTGRIYSAEQGRSLGFVSQVAEPEAFEEAVEKTVGEIAACSPLIVRMNKRAVNRCRGLAFPAAMKEANSAFLDELMKTEDTLEGIASFEEKRRPVWKNR